MDKQGSTPRGGSSSFTPSYQNLLSMRDVKKRLDPQSVLKTGKEFGDLQNILPDSTISSLAEWVLLPVGHDSV